jgi:hypothetical protein
MFQGTATDGHLFYGTPFLCDGSTGGADFSASIQVDSDTWEFVKSNPGTLIIDAVTTKGIVSKPFTPLITTVAGDGNGITLVAQESISSIMNTGTQSGGPVDYMGLPGVGFRLRWEPGFDIPPVFVNQLRVALSGNSVAASDLFCNRMVPYAYTDHETYQDAIDQYRTVSMSAWCQYQGSTLNDGGQHAAIMYRGGKSPHANGLYQYSKLSETPGSYQGALKLGSYSIWVPSNQRDMLFRDQFDRHDWELPYIVFAGIAQTADQASALRLRLVANHELISTAQFWSYEQADLDMRSIEIALHVLANFKTSMENPLHWAAIKDALRSAIDWTGRIAGWAYDNRKWIIPAGAGMAALLA